MRLTGSGSGSTVALTAGRRLSLAALLTVSLVAVPLVPGAAARAAAAAPEGASCSEVRADTVDARTVTGPNVANDAMHVAQAQQLARDAPGDRAQVSVVVVDSGTQGFDSPAASGLEIGHGLAVAGVVAGPDQGEPTSVPVAIAPDARVVDRPFYDALPGSTGEDVVVPTSAGLATRLSEVAGQVRSGEFGRHVVVVVPAQVPRTDPLEQAVAALVRSGALVVAASGDRADEDGFPKEFATTAPGEDAAGEVWPAAAEGVVAVGVSAPDARQDVLRNSGIDLVAPGVGAVSRGLNGGWCVLDDVSTHWAAAQVAGVAALVWSVHPDEDAAALRHRLEQTATGNGGRSSPITGFGEVQPVEAIQRRAEQMTPTEPEAGVRAQQPQAPADLLEGARDQAVWWGLAGGAALVVLVMLRPLLSRRRHTRHP